MEINNPWEANSRSDSQITRYLWAPKVHYWALSWAIIQSTSSHRIYLFMYVDIILPSMPR
jgi:hypothetical protein